MDNSTFTEAIVRYADEKKVCEREREREKKERAKE